MRNRAILSKQHPDHNKRIDTLTSYDILDTTQEADFDDIVALASKICDTPVSLISLVDDNRQWFKARVGFEPEETPLDQSVCSHAILEEDFLEIEDMATDTRTADNPLHTDGPEVKFYAGANLVAPNGMPIGTLCVLDTKQRKLTDFQRQALKTLSRQVISQLELRKRIQTEEAMRSEMDHRVKNSLQTIASVLRVAARKVTDAAALEVLELVERRLGAVASLHSELMGQDGKSDIPTSSYFEQLRLLLAEISPDHVTIKVEVDDGLLESRKASALGMIVSEFAANAIKHAFPDGRQGQVTIKLQKTGPITWFLECRDDGVGRHKQDDETTTSNTGLGELLMSSAATQLDGSLENGTGPDGTSMTVTFKG